MSRHVVRSGLVCQNAPVDIAQFLEKRRPRWQRLSLLLDKVDRRSLRGLAANEADELFTLYRLVSSDLNLVQTRTGNPALLEYLETLVGRAYANFVVPRRAGFFASWWRILRHYYPSTVRAEARLVALSTLVMLAGALLGFAATMVQPVIADVFLPAEHLAQSPAERVAELEALEREGETRVDSLSVNGVFSTFLFTHNIRVSVLCFALGLTFGIGTVVLLFFNGAMLGSLAALYLADGEMTFFIAWIGPHGVIELPCVLMAGGAGLMLARAQWRRDQGSTRSQIRAIRPALIDLMVGTATLLILAGGIEGGFSQINEPTLPYPFKIAVAAALLATLMVYLLWMPTRRRPADDDDDLLGHLNSERVASAL
jgi:uncharacterized membrane protein SpoIIM required for sporulation